MSAYALARTYQTHPDDFLNLAISEIAEHFSRTQRLYDEAEKINEEMNRSGNGWTS